MRKMTLMPAHGTPGNGTAGSGDAHDVAGPAVQRAVKRTASPTREPQARRADRLLAEIRSRGDELSRQIDALSRIA